MRCAVPILLGLLASAFAHARARPATQAVGSESTIAHLSARAYSSLDKDRFRWQIIRLCLKSPRPVPAAAAAAVRGRRWLQLAATQDGAKDDMRAADAYFSASMLSPCHASYYHERGVALMRRYEISHQPDDARFAAMSLHWYLEAEPAAPDAAQTAREISRLTAAAGASSDAELGWTPLVWAASFRDAGAVKSLLRAGADANARDIFFDGGMTPLGAAARIGDLEIVQLLVAHGARVYEPTADAVPLILAARIGNLGVVRYLLRHGAAINAVDARGYTALMRAVGDAPYPQDSSVTRYLIATGARTDVTGKDRMTALMLAAAYGNLAAVRDLVAGHAPVNASIQGATALLFAAFWNAGAMAHHIRLHPRTVEKIKCAGPPPLDFIGFEQTKTLVTSPYRDLGIPVAPVPDLHCHCTSIVALSCAKLRMARYLIAHDARTQEVDRRGVTPLYLAAESGQIGIVKLLVAHGVAVNTRTRNRSGNTPLGAAARGGHEGIVRFLASAGAALNARNCLGQTPLDLALGAGRSDSEETYAQESAVRAVVEFLEAHGGVSGRLGGTHGGVPSACTKAKAETSGT